MKKIFPESKIIIVLLILLINCLNKKYKIYINDISLYVELAITPEERQIGLMERKTLGENEGMLFVYNEEQYLSFWMKNTLIPLDIAFFDKEGYLIEIFNMQPHLEAIYKSSSPALYALEVNQGWFEKNQIKKFSKLKIPPVVQKEIEKKLKKN